MTRCGGLRVCVCVCPVQLPDIHDDDDDKLDLAASLPNPITNAMEASMTHLKLDNKDWGDDGTGVGLANLLSDATAAEDTRTPVSTRTRCCWFVLPAASFPASHTTLPCSTTTTGAVDAPRTAT